MAITNTVTHLLSNTEVPAGYSPPALPSFTSPAEESISVDLATAGITNANELTGFNALLTALSNYVTATYLPGLKLDTAQSITAQTTLTSVRKTNTHIGGTDKYQPGTEVFRCTAKVNWE